MIKTKKQLHTKVKANTKPAKNPTVCVIGLGKTNGVPDSEYSKAHCGFDTPRKTILYPNPINSLPINPINNNNPRKSLNITPAIADPVYNAIGSNRTSVLMHILITSIADNVILFFYSFTFLLFYFDLLELI